MDKKLGLYLHTATGETVPVPLVDLQIIFAKHNSFKTARNPGRAARRLEFLLEKDSQGPFPRD